MTPRDDSVEVIISARAPLAISVYAYRDESGDVRIDTVNRVVNLPTADEIFESMDQYEFDVLDAAFEEAERAKGAA